MNKNSIDSINLTHHLTILAVCIFLVCAAFVSIKYNIYQHKRNQFVIHIQSIPTPNLNAAERRTFEDNLWKTGENCPICGKENGKCKFYLKKY